MRRQRLKISDAVRAQTHAEELRLTRLGHMNERPPVAALAIKAPRFLEAGEAEVLQEPLHQRQVRRGKACIGNVLKLDN